MSTAQQASSGSTMSIAAQGTKRRAAVLGPELLSSSFPSLLCATPACQSWFRCPRQGTTKHAVNISWWLICDVYQLMLFSKGSCKPLGKYNQSITCGRRQLFHWEAELYLRNKQASHGYLEVHYLHANLGWKWRTSTYNSPREIQTANLAVLV